MPKKSAGLLLYRRVASHIEVLLVHPGGPFWTKKDAGAWSIPKGEFENDEGALATARREFREETGFDPEGAAIPLTPVRQPGGKWVYAWLLEGDLDPASVKSNTFSQEWPPRSGRYQEFPEVDRAAWFTLDEACRRILKGQVGLLKELQQRLPLSP
jgi:predicted NUDIX family NTP pyrophosphohydrolase